MPARAQTTTITPNGLGGYNIYTPPSIGSGGSFNPASTTTVSPNGLGGYNAYTPPSIGPNGGY